MDRLTRQAKGTLDFPVTCFVQISVSFLSNCLLGQDANTQTKRFRTLAVILV